MFALVAALTCALGAHAQPPDSGGSFEYHYDFVYNGIYYTINGNNTVEVAAPSENAYSGHVTIPNSVPYGGKTYSVTRIGDGVFYKCSGLTSVTIPGTVIRIGWYSFGSSGLTSVTIPNSVTHIDDFAFSGCDELNSVTLPNSIESIYESTFAGCCALTSVTIPNSVDYIGECAFLGCTQLNRVTLGSSLRRIADGAFAMCDALRHITCLAATPPEITNRFYGNFEDDVYNLATVYVPSNYKSAYKTADVWKNFTNIQELHYNFDYNGIYYRINLFDVRTVRVTYRPGGAKYSGNVTIPSSVPFDGQNYTVDCTDVDAFAGCTNLTSVTLPNTITVICDGTFSGCSSLTNITIPNSIEDIGSNIFKGCTNLSSVTLPLSLKKITESMFENCKSLTSVTIPDEVTSIGSRAFYGCSTMTSVTIPSNVSTIGQYAFSGCPLTSVSCLATYPPTLANVGVFDSGVYNNATLTVPQGRRAAYQSANYWKNFVHMGASIGDTFTSNGIYYKITSGNTVEVTYNNVNGNDYSGNVSIPSSVTCDGKAYSVTGIGASAFYMCENLTSVTLPGTVTNILPCAFVGCYNLTSINIPSSVHYISESAFAYCYSLTSIDIPGSVVYIGENVFEYCNGLTRVNITDVAAWCNMEMHSNPLYLAHHLYLNGTELTNLTIPSSVTAIDDNLFYGCYSLKSVTIGNSVTTIGVQAFRDCKNLKTLTIGNSVTTIGNGAFAYCSALTSVNIPTSVTTIDDAAFAYCSALTSVSIPTSVTKISNNMFYVDTCLTSVTIPTSVTTIGSGAFAYCSSLSSVTIPTSVTTINNVAFAYCSALTSVNIPNSVTAIGYGAFGVCSTMSNVTIGNSVDTIGEYAFTECPALTRVTCLANTPPKMAASNVFSDVTYSNATLMVPGGRKSAYQAANWWKNFSTVQERFYDFVVNGIYYNVTGDNTVEVTYKDATYNSYSGNVAIPGVVSYGGKSYNVTAIGEAAFRQSEGLTSVVIPISVKEIGTDAFYYCTSLTSVVIPSSVTKIGNYAFNYCTSLTNMTIGSSVTSIGYQAFRNCPALVSVTCLATTPPTLTSTTFISSYYSSVKLFVPKRALAAYQAANYWKNFTQMHPTLDYALNTDGGAIEFSSTGYYPWTNVVEDGRVYAVSGNKGAQSRSSTMTTTVTLPSDGRVTFAYKAWGEGTSSDVCTFSVDGTQKFSYGNKQNNWVNYSAQLSAGTHTLTWTYSKNSSVNPEGDYFAVDNVVITVNTIPGDADGDGVVTVGDVTAIIDMILSGVISGTPGADVDGNGIVNIADVTALIDYILTGN